MSKIGYVIREGDFLRGKNGRAEVVIYNTEAEEWEARFAASLIERWGMVAGELDGEDTAGRSKLRRMTPEEIVQHACDTSALAIAEFRKRGWTIELPSLPEANEKLKEMESKNS